MGCFFVGLVGSLFFSFFGGGGGGVVVVWRWLHDPRWPPIAPDNVA